MKSKKRKPAQQPSPAALLAELAAGPMFPKLFADQPLQLRSEIVDDSPFTPTSAIQHTIADLPPIDWEHVRRKEAQRKAQRRRPRRKVIAVFFAEDEQ